MPPLLTMLHISDLHIGLLDPGRAGQTFDAAVQDWWKTNKRFDGYLGHSGQALHQLAQFYYDLADTEGEVRVLVTGDVTTCGHPQEFANAEAFLAGRLAEPQRMSLVGLGVEWADIIAISGNHDNWSGVPVQKMTDLPMWAGPVAALRAYFGPFPRIFPTINIGNGRARLVFCAIDSDSEVPSTARVNRMLARGSCAKQCGELLDQLNRLPASPKDIRVLLVHHSYALGGGAGDLKLDDASRRALETLVINGKIKLMLTGHTHTSHVEPCPYPLAGSSPLRRLAEARCGSSTQLDAYPQWWPASARQRKTLPVNAALVHRIIDVGGELWWETERFVRTRAGKVREFERDPDPTLANPIRVVRLL